MLFDALESSVQRLQHMVGQSEFNVIATISILVFFWLTWRLWRFTIVPLIWPHDPLMLPYSIPLIGHTFAFLRDPEGTIRYGSRYFPGEGPYTITVGGLTFLIIRDPNDVAAVWRDTKSLSFDHYVQTSFSGIGVPKSHYGLMFRERPVSFYKAKGEESKELPFFVTENPSNRRYIDLQEEWIKEQFQPGERAQVVEPILLGYVNETLQWDWLSSPKILISEDFDYSGGSTKTLSLYNFCRYALVHAGSMTFLGPEILEIDPDFVQHYIEWDNTSWKAAHQHPSFLSRDLHRTSEKLIDVFMKYYARPPEQRPHLSWLFNRMQSEQQHLGLTLRDAASIGILMLWAVNLNTFRMAFWVLAHILCDPTLHAIINAELSAVRHPDNTFTITDLTSRCPILDAVWLECLRLYSTGAVARNTIRPTVIGNKTVRPGTQILGPLRPRHLQPSIFGPDAAEFNIERWIQDKNLASAKGFAPFGGGKTFCPGRFLAKKEVCRFVAGVLTRFEVRPAGDKKVPVGAVEKPALTMLDPRGDLLVQVREKRGEGSVLTR